MSANPPRRGTSLASTARRRRHLVNQALSLLDRWGYQEIEVPLLAPYEELRSTLDDDLAARLFRFVDRAGTLLVLRGDLTPIVARQFALRMTGSPLPARLAYANRVARVERAFAREEVESYEVGMELVGARGPRADLEVLTVAFDLLDELALDDVELRLGHVDIAGALLARLTERATRLAVARAVHLRDAQAVRDAGRAAGVAEDVIEPLAGLCALRPRRKDLQALAGSTEMPTAAAASELLEILDALDAIGLSDRVSIDLTATDDRGYYTGMRFHLVCEDAGEDIGSGGRYDSLYGHFGQDLPAVGFALRADRLVPLLTNVPGDDGPVDKVTIDGDDHAEVMRRAVRARVSGDRVRIAQRTKLAAAEDS